MIAIEQLAEISCDDKAIVRLCSLGPHSVGQVGCARAGLAGLRDLGAISNHLPEDDGPAAVMFLATISYSCVNAVMEGLRKVKTGN